MTPVRFVRTALTRVPSRLTSLFVTLLLAGCSLAGPGDLASTDYSKFVWPLPPDPPRIQLEGVIRGRADVEAQSEFSRRLIGSAPQDAYAQLSKPFAVAFDLEGRILVSDSGHRAIIRFDRQGRRMDVLGTRGSVRLELPLGLHVAPDGTIFVADGLLKRVVRFDSEGEVVSVYGHGSELQNPTDAALSTDGSRLFVADSKAHQIVVYDTESGDKLEVLGEPGDGEGQFAFPTSLAVGADASLYVVDQINSRVQVFTEAGRYLDQFGSLGVGYANFVRPKDVAVDEEGIVYVTDNAFNNVQLFDFNFNLLTFVGQGGTGPGRFHGASGVAVRGDQFAVVDQLGKRVQLFRFLVPKASPGG